MPRQGHSSAPFWDGTGSRTAGGQQAYTDLRSAIQGQDPNTLCLLTKANLQSMTLAEREKQYKTKAIGMIPGLRKKYEGKQTEFETLAEDENDERKVAIRLLTVVDNKDDELANVFF